jgi:hypothetical protein
MPPSTTTIFTQSQNKKSVIPHVAGNRANKIKIANPSAAGKFPLSIKIKIVIPSEARNLLFLPSNTAQDERTR